MDTMGLLHSVNTNSKVQAHVKVILISFNHSTVCDGTCFTCVGGLATECTSCGHGKYLDLNIIYVTYGSCMNKSNSGTPS
jgi:hypothetical protein